MEEFNSTAHWNKIYSTKSLKEVSWYQPVPETSLAYFADLEIQSSDQIIDVGGGDSFLVDNLLDEGCNNLSILDISEQAIERAKTRLASRESEVNWIVSNVVEFVPEKKFDLWHDRAAFHFLREKADIEKYVQIVGKSIKPGGHLVIGTFSPEGPTKCSGIEISQYSAEQLTNLFSDKFELVSSQNIDHPTPFETVQNFTFCAFQRNEN